MFKILLPLLFVLSICFNAEAQHFDPLYDPGSEMFAEKTWEDSGWYFVPTLVRFVIQDQLAIGNDLFATQVIFQSTDMSGLMFTGQALLLLPQNSFPAGFTPEAGQIGFASVLFPEDLLFCPSPEQEQGMGQNDPYFPLNLAGRLERINGQMPPNPIPMSVQLNDMTVN